MTAVGAATAKTTNSKPMNRNKVQRMAATGYIRNKSLTEQLVHKAEGVDEVRQQPLTARISFTEQKATNSMVCSLHTAAANEKQ